MARITPFKGANTAQFYVAEVTPGVTPTSPSWLPLRNTGGVPAVTRDALVSNELDGSRETSSIRTGNKQVSGEYAIELSPRSQDDFLAAALSTSWSGVLSPASLTITVDPVAKTFTAATAITNVEVGDLVCFTGLTGNNAKPFIVTELSGLVVTGGAINYDLTAEADKPAQLHYPERIETGSQCKTLSILTWFKGQCGGTDAIVITRGVEISGYSIEQAVNAMVTGSFPFIGTSQEIIKPIPPALVPAPPTGSTFTTQFTEEPFSSVDVSAFNGIDTLKLVNTVTITNDNAASSQFELGNDQVAFVERGRAVNTFSLAGMLYDLSFLQQFLDETEGELTTILTRDDNAMSFTLKKIKFTAATPEISGPESVTQSIEGQATGNANQSSIVIQRLSFA